MSINPFEYNPNYKQLFKIISPQDHCYTQEVVELYLKNNAAPHEAKYALLRYAEIESMFPRKFIHKFSDMIASEVVDDCGKSRLYITTIYGKDNILSNRFGLCCGTKTYLLNVEQAFYQVFFK